MHYEYFSFMKHSLYQPIILHNSPAERVLFKVVNSTTHLVCDRHVSVNVLCARVSSCECDVKCVSCLYLSVLGVICIQKCVIEHKCLCVCVCTCAHAVQSRAQRQSGYPSGVSTYSVSKPI